MSGSVGLLRRSSRVRCARDGVVSACGLELHSGQAVRTARRSFFCAAGRLGARVAWRAQLRLPPAHGSSPPTLTSCATERARKSRLQAAPARSKLRRKLRPWRRPPPLRRRRRCHSPPLLTVRSRHARRFPRVRVLADAGCAGPAAQTAAAPLCASPDELTKGSSLPGSGSAPAAVARRRRRAADGAQGRAAQGVVRADAPGEAPHGPPAGARRNRCRKKVKGPMRSVSRTCSSCREAQFRLFLTRGLRTPCVLRSTFIKMNND